MITRRGSILVLMATIPALTLRWAFPPAAATDHPAAGKVSRIKGTANFDRDGATAPLADGTAIMVGDAIVTGADSRLELTLLDETKVTLGANAKLVVDKYLYDPGKGQGATLLDIAKGAFRFTTGKMASLKDRNMQVRTEFASLSVRGTDFWGGPIDNSNGVLAIKGKVEVKTEKGTVVLEGGKQGSMVAGIDEEPGPIKVWAQAKIDRAIATIAF